MASPPNSAGSPPGPSHLALPKQRPPMLALPSKSRKPSLAAPLSAHPLRQTSFPPADRAADDGDLRTAQYSPGASEDLDDFSDSEITSAISGPHDDALSRKRKRGEKRPRGRPVKNPVARTGSVSLINGEEGRKRGTTAGAPSVVTGEADDEDDDDEDDGGLGARGEAFTMDPAELDRDNQRRYLFREAVPPNHQNRYDAFNKVKLRTADVRRLVNATLSQSVPQNVVTVVGSYTKMFAGMLIESARQVQGEWLASNPTRADGEAQLAYKRLRMMQPESESESEDEDEDEDANADVDGGEPMEMDKDSPEKEQKTPNGATEQANPIADDTASQDEIDAKPVMNGDSPINGAASQPSINSLSAGTQDTIADGTPEKHKEKKTKESKPGEVLPDDFGYVQPGAWGLSKYVEECDRGPLQPDHLREALRRYKKSRSGGTVGFTGISLYGMENRDVAASRMGGRRLFK